MLAALLGFFAGLFLARWLEIDDGERYCLEGALAILAASSAQLLIPIVLTAIAIIVPTYLTVVDHLSLDGRQRP